MPPGSGVGRVAVCAGIVPGGAYAPCVPQGEGHADDPRGRPVCTSLQLGGRDKGRGVSNDETARSYGGPHGVICTWSLVFWGKPGMQSKEQTTPQR